VPPRPSDPLKTPWSPPTKPAGRSRTRKKTEPVWVDPNAPSSSFNKGLLSSQRLAAKALQLRQASKQRRAARARSQARINATRWRQWGVLGGSLFVIVFLLWLSKQEPFVSHPLLLTTFLLVIAVTVFWVWRQQALARRRQSDIQRLDWAQFYPVLCHFLEKHDYTLIESGNQPGIVDLVVRKDRQTYLVHAKSWKSSKVGVDVVSKLYAAMVSRGMTNGIVVGGSRFARSAQELARETQIQLVDGDFLQQWFSKQLRAISRVNNQETRLKAAQPQPEAMDTQMLPRPSSAANEAGVRLYPTCPLCNAPMLQRKARRGRHEGRRFWGCTRHQCCVLTGHQGLPFDRLARIFAGRAACRLGLAAIGAVCGVCSGLHFCHLVALGVGACGVWFGQAQP
jgi:HJR/Mrr/RecB family endonuclease